MQPPAKVGTFIAKAWLQQLHQGLGNLGIEHCVLHNEQLNWISSRHLWWILLIFCALEIPGPFQLRIEVFLSTMMRSVESKCCISKKSRGPGIEATLPGSQMFSVQSQQKNHQVQISAAALFCWAPSFSYWEMTSSRWSGWTSDRTSPGSPLYLS